MSNSIALITGASSPIGQAISRRLTGEGYCLALAGRNGSRLAALQSEIKLSGGSAGTFIGDLCKEEYRENLFNNIQEHFGMPVSVLVNNAAICPHCSTLTEKIIIETLTVNTAIPLLFAKQFASQLCDNTGCIINIVSTAAIQPLGQGHHYVASKAGLDGITRSLALELAPTIRVNAVAPGFVATPNHIKKRTMLEKHIPMKYLISPQEIADAVYFLVENKSITGQTIIIDGGWTLSHYDQ